jgi:hypothetical protein
VLDSTHPDAVAALTEELDPARLLVLVSSKSGTTLETGSLFEYFWDWMKAAAVEPGPRFCAVTDPGSELAGRAASLGFRRIFEAPSDVGGRFSALSVFGLVPAALLGVDLDGWAGAALSEIDANRPGRDPSASEALRLGAALGELAAEFDKITLKVSSNLAGFPAWIEQLIAESLGKRGRGLVPVINEPDRAPAEYSRDRFFITLALGPGEAEHKKNLRRRLERAGHPVIGFDLDHPCRIAGEMVRWEIATAAAGAVLGVHPFNQPDVQLSKILTRDAMAEAAPHPADGTSGPDMVAAASGSLRPAISAWLDSVREGDYLSLQAFLAPGSKTREALDRIRLRCLERTAKPVTVGFGPRFLHSTGQLHKGGPESGVFLQLIDEPRRDLPIPGRGYGFQRLIRAQALGDYRALRERGRRILRVNLGGDVAAGLDALLDALSS